MIGSPHWTCSSYTVCVLSLLSMLSKILTPQRLNFSDYSYVVHTVVVNPSESNVKCGDQFVGGSYLSFKSIV